MKIEGNFSSGITDASNRKDFGEMWLSSITAKGKKMITYILKLVRNQEFGNLHQVNGDL